MKKYLFIFAFFTLAVINVEAAGPTPEPTTIPSYNGSTYTGSPQSTVTPTPHPSVTSVPAVAVTPAPATNQNTNENQTNNTPAESNNNVAGGQVIGGSAPAAETLHPEYTDTQVTQQELLGASVVAAKKITISLNRSLRVGSRGNDVKALQQFLNTSGFTITKRGIGSVGYESMYFGPATKAAVIRFQKAFNITPTIGLVGPKTIALLRTLGR